MTKEAPRQQSKESESSNHSEYSFSFVVMLLAISELVNAIHLHLLIMRLQTVFNQTLKYRVTQHLVPNLPLTFM